MRTSDGGENMKNVYVVDALRTPFGSFGGSLADVPAPHLAGAVMKALLEKVDRFWGEVDLLQQCLHHRSRKMRRGNIRQRSSERTERSSQGVHHVHVFHVLPSIRGAHFPPNIASGCGGTQPVACVDGGAYGPRPYSLRPPTRDRDLAQDMSVTLQG